MTTPNPFKEKWLTFAEVREDLCHNGFRAWCKKTHTVKSELQVIGNVTYVCPKLVVRYLEATSHPAMPRATKRPKGWLGIDRVREILGCGAKLPRYWVTQGKLHAVQVTNTHFYDPESVERFRLEREKPLPGYVQIKTFVVQAGGDIDRAKKWIKANGYPIKFFYVGTAKSICSTQEGVTAWLEMWAQKPKNPTPRRLKLSAEQVEQFQAARASGTSVRDLAKQHGISSTYMSRLTRAERLPKTALRRAA